MTPKDRSFRLYIAGMMVGLVPLVSYICSPLLPIHPHHAFMLGYGIALLPFLLVMKEWDQIEVTTHSLLWIISCCFLVRVLLLLVPPILSEDLWRYIWDGSLQWYGQNPYTYAPEDSNLDQVTQSAQLEHVRSQIGHAHIPTIYPPAAQASFVLATALCPSQILLRLTMILADVSIVTTLWFWAKHRDVHPGISAVYGFLPLSVIESSVGGHVDSVGVAALVYALYLWDVHKPWKSGFFLWCAAGVKIVPAILIIPMWKLDRARAWQVSIVFLILTALTLCIYGTYPRGLIAFAQKWRGNEGVFAWINWVIETQWISDSNIVSVSEQVESLIRRLVGAGSENYGFVYKEQFCFALTKILVLLVLGLVTIYAYWKTNRLSSFWLAFMGCLLLVSPMVHPWYLLWVIPFILLIYKERPKLVYAFIYWSLSMWLTYWPRPNYLETGEWTPLAWTPYVIYVPVYIYLLWALKESRNTHSTNRAAIKNS